MASLILTSASEPQADMEAAIRAAGYAPETETVEAEPVVATPEKTETPAPADEKPVVAETETPPESESEATANETQETEEVDEDGEPVLPEKLRAPLPKPVLKKIDRLTAAKFRERGKREAAEARAIAAERELAELRAAATKPAEKETVKPADPPAPEVVEKPKPRWDDFADAENQFEAFGEAMAEYKAEKLLAATLAKRDEAAKVADTQNAVVDAWAEKVQAIKAEPGYENIDVMMNDDEAKAMQLSMPMIRAIQSSAIGPKIAYHLRTHPEECERIFKATMLTDKSTQDDVQDAILAVGEAFGEIKAALKAKKPAPAKTPEPVAKKPVAEPEPEPDPEPVAPPPVPEKQKTPVSQAPAPFRPVGTKAASPPVDGTSMTADEFYRYREAQKQKR